MTRDLCLIVETSADTGSVAVASERSGEILEEREFASDRRHNAAIFGPLEALLAGFPRERIGRVLVGAGPGSYSGTRVGIAASQGIAIALGLPAVAMPSIAAVACAAPGTSCVAIGDARRGQFWSAGLEGLTLAAGPAICDGETLAIIVAAAVDAGRVVFTFDAPESFPLNGQLRERIRQDGPTAGRLWRAWREAPPGMREAWAAAEPQPVYLKPPHITAAKRPWLVV